MKKITFTLLVCVFASSACFAQEGYYEQPEQPAANATAAPVPPETRIFSGKVDSVSPTKSLVTVMDENLKVSVFGVTADTLIIDKEGAPLNFGNIAKYNKVVIEYTTDRQGFNTAKSIKIVANW